MRRRPNLMILLTLTGGIARADDAPAPESSTAEALGKAQFVRSEEKSRFRYDWGAWVLWGLPR